MENTALAATADEYAQRRRLTLVDHLGAGVQGIVFRARNQVEAGQSALKVHRQEAGYLRERDAYFRLAELGITQIRRCHVPELIAHDDRLWAIEMTIVTRPFVLDFGGAYLDRPPAFSEEVMAEWRVDKQEQFGTHWEEVQTILRELEAYGIFMVDTNPGNISFGN